MLYSTYPVGLPADAVKATLTVRLLLAPMVATTLVGCDGTTAAQEEAGSARERRDAAGRSAGMRGAGGDGKSAAARARRQERGPVWCLRTVDVPRRPQRRAAPHEPRATHGGGAPQGPHARPMVRRGWGFRPASPPAAALARGRAVVSPLYSSRAPPLGFGSIRRRQRAPRARRLSGCSQPRFLRNFGWVVRYVSRSVAVRRVVPAPQRPPPGTQSFVGLRWRWRYI